jgi:hypothetical protein
MESEADEYRRNGNDIVVCPDEAQGNLCRVRNWILDEMMGDYDGLVLMDDDISRIFEYQDTEKVYMKGEDWMEFCEMMGILCRDANVFFFGINPASDKGSYREHMPFSFTAYIGGPIQGFMKGNRLRYDEGLPLKEDYDMSLQQVQHYGYVLRANWCSLDVKQSEQEGGCSTYRNLEKEKDQFFKLRKKWGSKWVRYDGSSKRGFDYNPIIKFPY